LLVVAGKAKVSLLSVDGNENILYLLKGGDVDGPGPPSSFANPAWPA
jgi:CRP-like cAMP-binding protein